MESTSYVFFFQAEDGIRDGHVTGVQTCALPISTSTSPWQDDTIRDSGGRRSCESSTTRRSGRLRSPPLRSVRRQSSRSEERRVGKECRARRSRYRAKKKNNITIYERRDQR